MKTLKLIFWSILLLLFLAACGADDTPDLDGDTAEVRIFSSLSATQNDGLSAQGVPTDPATGQSGVTRAVLEVFDLQSDEQLFFKGGQVVSEAEGEPITLTPQDSNVALALPPGTYSFFLTGFDDREPANELAFGLAEFIEIRGADQQITIPLSSYLGEISFRVPERVEANAVFDAFLEVSAPGRPDLRVPEGDYAVEYVVAEPSQKLSESQLGVRIAVACEEVQITALVRRVGARAAGGASEASASVPVNSGACDNSGDIGADLVPPFISIVNLGPGAEVDASFTLSGDVNDQQSGVERVEVYEGTLKLGEAAVNRDEMNWSFDVSLEEGSYTLIVVAFDKAGNTRRQEVNVTVSEGDGANSGECTNPVNIPDENLRDTFRGALGLADDAELTCEVLAELTELRIGYFDGPEAEPFNVVNLEGLQYALNLERLELQLNTFRGSSPIEDLSPLAGLKNLTYLKIDKEDLKDLSFLAGLTSLEELDLTPLQSGSVSDISPLRNLVNLERLYLSRNGLIRDISALANLTKLEILDLDGAEVRDITPLEGLTNLDVLVLSGNEISDLNPLLANEGLGEGDDEISLIVNCFNASNPDVLAILQQLEARNPDQTNVSYDEMFEPNSAIDCSYLE